MARIAIIGPGAIGGTMAAWLAYGGRHEVILCARRPMGALTLESPEGTFTVSPRVFTEPDAVPAVDWVVVTTKAYDAAGAGVWLKRLAAGGVPVAVIQNGVEHRERFSPYVAPERILPVLAYCPAERVEQTVIRQRRAARLVVQDDAPGRAFAAVFAGTKVEVAPTADLPTALWEKLCVNAVGALNALLLRPTGVFSEENVAALARELIRECIAVGRAEGARLDDGTEERVLQFYLERPADSINSLHADRLAGRPMEIDARNGVIVRFGHRHGIATPYNRMAVMLLEAV